MGRRNATSHLPSIHYSTGEDISPTSLTDTDRSHPETNASVMVSTADDPDNVTRTGILQYGTGDRTGNAIQESNAFLNLPRIGHPSQVNGRSLSNTLPKIELANMTCAYPLHNVKQLPFFGSLQQKKNTMMLLEQTSICATMGDLAYLGPIS